MEIDIQQDTPSYHFDESDGVISHKDLALIATDRDGITINRTKRKTSPFAPILKTPNIAQNSGNQAGYSVEVQDPDAPTGYRTVCDHVSPNYLLIPNDEFFQVGQRIADETGYRNEVSRIFWDGSRFAVIFDFPEVSADVTHGDNVNLSLVMRTSYNKTWAAEAALMGKRFLCDNGVLSGEFFSRVRFKHTQGSSNWDELIQQGIGAFATAGEGLEDLVNAMRIMRNVEVDHRFLRELFVEQIPQIGPLNTGKIITEFVAEDDRSAYGLLNAGTGVFWHDKGFSATNFDQNRLLVDGMVRTVTEMN